MGSTVLIGARGGRGPSGRTCARTGTTAAPATAQANPAAAAFAAFVEGVWPEAQKAGVSRATFDRAFKGVTPDLTHARSGAARQASRSQVHGQAEFVRPPQDYLNRAQLARLAVGGKAFMAKHLPWLEKIEKEIGVERHVVMGIWGRETAYGAHKLPHYAIRVLATQAWIGRRKEMFRTELIAGLKMLEDKVVTVETMRSSWAGALGLPQFMPSDYYKHAYDIDGDGRKDIWNSVPDALASAAQQLKSKGWKIGVPWGFEVALPAKVDCALEGPGDERPLGEWAQARRHARRRPSRSPTSSRDQPAYLMSPGGTHGPMFLVTENFKVIRAYNTSDLYAVFVGHLADRIAGGGDFATPWRGIGQLPTAEIEETQQRLKERGFAISIIDGKIGSNTRRQIGLFQRTSRHRRRLLAGRGDARATAQPPGPRDDGSDRFARVVHRPWLCACSAPRLRLRRQATGQDNRVQPPPSAHRASSRRAPPPPHARGADRAAREARRRRPASPPATVRRAARRLRARAGGCRPRCRPDRARAHRRPVSSPAGHARADRARPRASSPSMPRCWTRSRRASASTGTC